MQLNHIEQSSAWARFRKTIKIGKSHLSVRKLPRGLFWLECARGKLSGHDIKKAKKTGAIFLRIEPPLGYNFPRRGRKAHAHYQPEETLVLDLSLSEEDILKQMKPKGRYNIKLAREKGVEVRQSTDVKIFCDLLNETTVRDKFHSHPCSYYEKFLGSLPAKLFVAYFEEKPIAALIATFYKNTATYYFGASSDEHRNIMAPYLLQWEVIRHARAKGCQYYDFLGIAPSDSRNHPWQGVTQFKKKFGGTIVKYPCAREYVFRPILYYALVLLKKIRSIVRN